MLLFTDVHECLVKRRRGPGVCGGVSHISCLGARRRRLAGAERGSRFSQGARNALCVRMRSTEHLPSDPFYFLERRHGLPQGFLTPIAARGQ